MVLFLFEFMLMILSVLILLVCVLVGVAFLTLFERSVLGYIQVRKGPNKVGYMGILQPFSDAIKLFVKEQTYPILSNYMSYYFSPVGGLVLSLLCWLVVPYAMNLYSFELGLLFFLAITSLGVYTVLVAGWSSNCMYSLLGGLRAVAQTVSYEVSMALLMLSFILLMGSFNLFLFEDHQSGVWFFFMGMPLGITLFVSFLAETNRTPFDFAEGESELVSGFNVEYSSGGFALIFLAEYASILFMSMLVVVMFMGSGLNNMSFYLKLLFVSFGYLWVRGTLPRFRYDKLMYLAWKSFLPLSLNYLLLFIGLKVSLILLL